MDVVTKVSDNKTTDIAANNAGYTARTPKKVLDSDDFMALLSAQMANQDPMEPMKDTAFVSQMASFSSLASMNSLTKSFAEMNKNNSKLTAASYLGCQVTLTDPTTSANVSGTVSAIDTSGDEPKIQVNGSYYALSTVKNIAYPTSTSNTDTTVTDYYSRMVASSYLGKQVTLTDPSTAKSVTGTVAGIDTSSGEAKVLVNGTYYNLSAIKSISSPTSTTTTDGTGS